MKQLIPFLFLTLIAFPVKASESDMISLPPPSDIFTIGLNPLGSGKHPYFTEESLLKILPSLKPAVVTMKVGDRRVYQSGVIVTKDKKCIFWRTCDPSFIQIDTGGSPIFFAIKSPHHIP